MSSNVENKDDKALDVREISRVEAKIGEEQDYISSTLELDEATENDVRQAIRSGRVEIEDAVVYLRDFLPSHDLDQYLALDMMDEIKRLLHDYDNRDGTMADEKFDLLVNKLKTFYYVFYYHSPYAEIRASVSNTDDPTLPVDTFRSWFLGIFFVAVFATVNQLFSLRFPRIGIESICIQVLAYPCGMAMARWLPTKQYRFLGKTWSFNPGPFNQKEHMLITVMANIGLLGFYSSWIFEVQILEVFFDQPSARNRLYQYCVTLSMQCLGFGIAGLVRSCIVYPDFCVWPYDLPIIVLNRTLHDKRSGTTFTFFRRTVTRYRYLLTLVVLYFIWHMLGPGYLFSGSLENFNWITWIKPQSKVLALIFGGRNGLGLNPWPTWDWPHSVQMVDPLVAPFFATLNYAIGMLLVGLLFNLPFYLTNTWNSGYLPFNSNKLYDRYGNNYKVRDIIDKAGRFDAEKYANYSPLYVTGAYAIKNGFYFACYSATVVHCGLFYYRQVWSGFKGLFSKKHRDKYYTDVHNRLMRAYPETPQWWFVALYVTALALAAFALRKFLPDTPIWVLGFASGISIVLLVPMGIIDSVTGSSVQLNVISELIGGYAVPGDAISLNMFKGYGCWCMLTAIFFSKDLKLGHYAKIPPRSMFRAQLAATLISAICSLTMLNWQLDNIKDICEEEQKQKFLCMETHTFFTSSVIWGTIGPAKLYSPGGIYHATLWAFLLGALLPIPLFLLSRWRYPQLRHIFTPALLKGGMFWAPLNMSYAIPGLYLGYIFQVHIKRRFFSWWSSYNYLTSSALCLGAAVGAMFAFFALQFNGIEPDWWGTRVSDQGVDQKGFSWYEIPKEGFGPGPGEF